MDIVKFWQDTVNYYNQISKCGYCWNFGAPLTESALNIQKPKDTAKCCVNLFLTNLRFESIFKDGINGNSFNESCDYYFDLYLLLPSSLGVNNYNEIPNHEITESKWATIYKPLFDCFGCGFDADFCRHLGFQAQIKKMIFTQVHNYSDMNYSGYKIQIQFRVKQ